MFSDYTNFTSADFSADERFLSVGTTEEMVTVWSLSGGEKVANLPVQADRVAFSPDGRTLATGSQKGGLAIWDLQTGAARILRADESEQNSYYHIYRISNLEFVADAQALIAGSQACHIEVWDTDSGNLNWTIENNEKETWFSNPSFSIAISPFNQEIALGNGDKIHFFDPVLQKNTQSQSNSIMDESIVSIVFLPDDHLIVFENSHGFQLWQREPFELIYTVEEPYFKLTSSLLTASPDGSLLASSDSEGTIYLWRTENGQLLAELPGHRGEISQLVFSSSGKYLASASQDGTVRLWGVP